MFSLDTISSFLMVIIVGPFFSNICFFLTHEILIAFAVAAHAPVVVSSAKGPAPTYQLFNGFIIELQEPTNHGETKITSYSVQFYQRKTETIGNVPDIPVFDPLSTPCTFTGVRVGQSYLRSSQSSAFNLRGACVGNGIVGSSTPNSYRFNVCNTFLVAVNDAVMSAVSNAVHRRFSP